MRPTGIRLVPALLSILLIPDALAVGPIDPAQCTVTTRATQPVSIVVAPEGGGTQLNQAYAFGGQRVDATIDIVIRDGDGEPFALLSADDLHLEGPGLGFCRFFNTADYPTNRDGYTIMQNTRQAYGTMAEPGLEVYFGDAILGDGVIPYLRVNSPDLSADGAVDLADVGRFAMIFHGEYDYAADFVWDGVLNLADVSIMAINVGRRCYY